MDIYAAGLPCLATIQAPERCSKLVPQIETSQDHSELQVRSIGQLTAERVKYKVKELDIVQTQEIHDTSGAEAEKDTGKDLRKMIQKMTCVDPKERITAAQVQQLLQQVRKIMLIV